MYLLPLLPSPSLPRLFYLLLTYLWAPLCAPVSRPPTRLSLFSPVLKLNCQSQFKWANCHAPVALPRSTYVCRLLPMPGNSWSWMWNSFSMSIFISLLGYSPLSPLPTVSGHAPLHASAMQLLLVEGRKVDGARGFPGAMLRIHTSDTICLPKNQDNNYNGTGSRMGRSRRGV